MEDWANKLAGELKCRNNPSVLGPIIGMVITPPPDLKISILDGHVYITEVYILDVVLEEFERVLTLPIETISGEITLQPYETTRENQTLLDPQDYKINIIELQNKRIVTKDTLKSGDQVLLISSQDNQKYFCLGRVTRLGRD